MRERAPRVEGEGPSPSVLRERASVLRARPPPLEGEGLPRLPLAMGRSTKMGIEEDDVSSQHRVV